VNCPTCKRPMKNRSTEANRRYWALLHELSEKEINGQRFSSDTWHIYCKQRFIGDTEVELPNGKTHKVPASTAGMTNAEFASYADEVEAWASEHGVYLPE